MTRVTPGELPEDTAGPYMQTDATGTYIAHNEDAIYLDPDWEDPNAAEYVDEGAAPIGLFGTTAPKRKFDLVRRSGDTVTVRSNYPATFSGSVPFNGSISGTFPAGATFSGRDSNRNNLPDVLEKAMKYRNIQFGTE